MPVFSNITIPNNIRPCLYQLSIRSPGPHSAEYATYTFPLSPALLQADVNTLAMMADLKGPALTGGVTRNVDHYGIAPPVFRIEGTTGWDSHVTDGYILPGLQSLNLLQTFLVEYQVLNQQQLAQGNPQLYTLEFYDFFTPQFWQIEPIGPQGVRYANDKPLLGFYKFRWLAIAPVGAPTLGEIDAMAQVLNQPVAVAALGAASTLGAVLTVYTGTGLTLGSLL
jgi:hypothetical protein